MRAVIQRANKALVCIDGEVTASISHGLVVLVGFEDSDSEDDIRWLSPKIINLRIFNDAGGVMNLSVKDTGGEVLIVSQFTLFASTRKGNRPSYIRAARPELSVPLYNTFVKQMEMDLGKTVQTGRFGSMMEISLVNSGPVTIIMDTKNKE